MTFREIPRNTYLHICAKRSHILDAIGLIILAAAVNSSARMGGFAIWVTLIVANIEASRLLVCQRLPHMDRSGQSSQQLLGNFKIEQSSILEIFIRSTAFYSGNTTIDRCCPWNTLRQIRVVLDKSSDRTHGSKTCWEEPLCHPLIKMLKAPWIIHRWLLDNPLAFTWVVYTVRIDRPWCFWLLRKLWIGKLRGGCCWKILRHQTEILENDWDQIWCPWNHEKIKTFYVAWFLLLAMNVSVSDRTIQPSLHSATGWWGLPGRRCKPPKRKMQTT